MSPATARKAIDWKILITIGAALAVSKAMEKTGGAEALANALLQMAGDSEQGIIAVIYLATMICSQVMAGYSRTPRLQGPSLHGPSRRKPSSFS